MTPERAIFIIFPFVVIVWTILTKVVFFKSKKLNYFVLFSVYICSNTALYILVEGAFIGREMLQVNVILQIFADLTVRQWLWILCIPNIFTFMYLIICFMLLLLFDKMPELKSKIMLKRRKTA
ncbi:hypothetical protein CVD25_01805 [Bacillus canaveralius]|uniref:Uncharacterized protein n=1 Tax=Bacillus canaveralius TaxID=1403243 RepID=A0A2N5GJB1_9BACI|nr:hypothetical protein CU635_15695 [Bacillus canaveralius]PLR86631.1 hypothetical protein CVD23_05695 [Bacillus sp. V33-4]PLS00649.1 hypothetical protein CVD25_01805 [Bacillus canaveralius]